METQTGRGPEAAAHLPGPLCFRVLSEMLAGDRTGFPSKFVGSSRRGWEKALCVDWAGLQWVGMGLGEGAAWPAEEGRQDEGCLERWGGGKESWGAAQGLGEGMFCEYRLYV